MYNKFVNSTTKIRRVGASVQITSSAKVPTVLENQEFDSNILESLKTSLQRDFTNWSDVKDRWEKTFVLRQQELKQSDNTNLVLFLKEWPLYSHANAKDLVSLTMHMKLVA